MCVTLDLLLNLKYTFWPSSMGIRTSSFVKISLPFIVFGELFCCCCLIIEAAGEGRGKRGDDGRGKLVQNILNNDSRFAPIAFSPL